MQLHLGKPPPTPDFDPKADGWTPLREPSPLVLNLLATPVGLLTAVLVGLAWSPANSSVEVSSTVFGPLTPLVFLAGLILIGLPGLIALHELIHALGYPRFGFDRSTVITIWPSKLLICAITFHALRRNRLLLVYLLPLLVISIVPLVVCRLAHINSGLLMLASVVNALAAGGDVVCFFLILFQVPASAELRNQGWATWWRIAP
jgi:hypothetical protein